MKKVKKLKVDSDSGCRSIQGFFLPVGPSVLPESARVLQAPLDTVTVATEETDMAVDEETAPDMDGQQSDSTQYSRFINNPRNLDDTGVPLSDFGYAAKIVIEQAYTLSDSDINHFLKNRWQPQQKDQFPVSHHNKGGKVRPRCINSQHLEQFPWLAISRLQNFEGAWCASCVLFKTSDEGDGWGGGGQRMGRLVLKPLTDFSDLTGKSGSLTLHATSTYHRTCAERASHFIQQFGQPNRDIRNQLSTVRMQQVSLLLYLMLCLAPL